MRSTLDVGISHPKESLGYEWFVIRCLLMLSLQEIENSMTSFIWQFVILSCWLSHLYLQLLVFVNFCFFWSFCIDGTGEKATGKVPFLRRNGTGAISWGRWHVPKEEGRLWFVTSCKKSFFAAWWLRVSPEILRRRPFFFSFSKWTFFLSVLLMMV